MPFIIKIPGHPEVEDLDFTLDQMDMIERESGVFWVLASPFKSAKVAKAYLKAAYRMHGLDPDDVDTLRQRDMRGWIDFRADESDAEAAPTTPTKGRTARKRPASSVGAPTPTTGPPPSPGSNASETS